MTDDTLTIDKVSAGYAGKDVIRDVSLQIHRGETFGLIGLNGAGKTTLIKTILGLKDASAGKISILGAPGGSSAAKKNLAFLPERFEPAWFLNAYEFIDFTLKLYGGKPDHAKAESMAVKLGLNVDYLSKRSQTYSKGMRQKLGLMATLLTPCSLLILDEPMSGLDPLARAQVKSILQESRGQGKTIFLSSHILSDMEELCDRVGIIHGGTIVFTGKPADLLVQTRETQLESAFLKLIGQSVQSAA